MKSIAKHTPPENVQLKVYHKISGIGAPEREGWETIGTFKNKTWRLKQNQGKIVDFRNPTHWDNIN